MKIIVTLLQICAFSVLLTACGSSGSSEAAKPDTPAPPVANAGTDQQVLAGLTVSLDGSGSYTSTGASLSYHWIQLSGTSVDLSDSNAMSPQFAAPNVSTAEQLIFELQVSHDTQVSEWAQVSVTITPVTTDCSNPSWNPLDFDTVYRVGPGEAYNTPSDVPWEQIEPGTLVMIYGRDQPYRDKWVINVEASEQQPVVVLGVPVDGNLPIISGENAATRTALNYWNENRSVIKVGASSIPDNDNASHITIECLDIRSAKPGYVYTNDSGTSNQQYSSNAAAITVEQGEHITVRHCELHDAGNGLFTTSLTSDVLISSNHIYDNGISGSYYEHNSYTESAGITFEYNHYGPLCSGCLGNNLKDRSTGTVIRYNWIEDGNRQLDLVDTGHSELLNEARYHQTFVYGNILIEGDGEGNSQIIHYGGDSGDQDYYRKGTLHLYHNTIVSTRSGNTTLINLSSNDEALDARNNIIYNTAGGSRLALVNSSGTIHLQNNWLPLNWRESHSGFSGSLNSSGNIEETTPGFQDFDNQNFVLSESASGTDAGTALSSDAMSFPIRSQYVVHQGTQSRIENANPTLGALK